MRQAAFFLVPCLPLWVKSNINPDYENLDDDSTDRILRRASRKTHNVKGYSDARRLVKV